MTYMPKRSVYIVLSRKSSVYNPGDVLSGQVHVAISKPQTTRAILIKFTGAANIFIAKEIVRKMGHKHEPHRWNLSRMQDEQIFDQRFYLLGNKKENPQTIQIGLHEFPFEFKVPLNIPATYYGHNGSIKYTLSVENHNDLLEEVCEQVITVQGFLDLNAYPAALKSASCLVMEKIMLPCCRKGQAGFKLEIHKTGYIPGDRLQFKIEIYNFCKGAVFTYVNLELLQICNCNAHDLTDSSTLSITQADGIDFPNPKYDELSEWIGHLDIPSCLPTNFGGDLDTLHLEYFLKVNLRFQTHRKHAIDIFGEIRDIIIGSVGFEKTRIRNLRMSFESVKYRE